MPSAANAKSEKPASSEAADNSPIRQIMTIIEHKIRNLEKRKVSTSYNACGVNKRVIYYFICYSLFIFNNISYLSIPQKFFELRDATSRIVAKFKLYVNNDAVFR